MAARLRLAMAAILAFASASVAAGGSGAPSPRHLRFSPDGRHVLAQDDADITMLTVQPFAVLLHVPSEKAGLADFTPDSRQIVFVSLPMLVDSLRSAFSSSAAHVERWSVTDHARVSFIKIPWRACGTQELSPDGRVLACVDFEGTLRLIDVSSAQAMIEKKRFVQLVVLYDYTSDVPLPNGVIGDPGSARMDFSPDGRFLIADPRGGHGSAVVCNLHETRHLTTAQRPLPVSISPAKS